MKKIVLLIFFVSSMFSQEFYSKIEALNSYVIKASVSGKVMYTNEEIEGKTSNNSIIVKLDDKVDVLELEQNKNKLKFLNEMIIIEKNNYKRLKNISSKSIFDKQNQKIKYINLESQKTDLLVKISFLEDKIKNKKLVEKDLYIFALMVKKGDYVNPGTILYEALDLSSGKVEIFIPISESSSIKDKIIYLNDKKTDLKINKIYKVADSKHISSLKVEIIIPNVKTFSRLAKIEFK